MPPGRLRYELGGDGGEEPCRLGARLQDLTLCAFGPALVEVGSAQVDDRIGPFEVRGVEHASGRIPTTLVPRRGLSSHEPDDLVAVGAQRGEESRADEPGGAAHDDPHAAIVAGRPACWG